MVRLPKHDTLVADNVAGGYRGYALGVIIARHPKQGRLKSCEEIAHPLCVHFPAAQLLHVRAAGLARIQGAQHKELVLPQRPGRRLQPSAQRVTGVAPICVGLPVTTAPVRKECVGYRKGAWLNVLGTPGGVVSMQLPVLRARVRWQL